MCDGSSLTDTEIEDLTLNWRHLETLHFRCDFPMSEAACASIKANCHKLQYLEMSLPQIGMDMEYSFFKEILTLRKITNDERTFYRRDFYNMRRYLIKFYIPYEEIGILQDMIPEYNLDGEELSDSDSDSIYLFVC